MFALALGLTLFALLLLLPLLTSLRLGRALRELEELRARVAALEAAQDATAQAHAGTASLDAAAISREGVRRAEPGYAGDAAPPRGDSVAASEPQSGAASPGERPELSYAPAAAGLSDEQLDLEGRIGGRWLLYTGVFVLLLGVSFFLKYAFENAWINETGRVLSGGAAGIALVVAGWRLSARGLDAFGQALIGTGFAVLYLSIYAALSFYALIGGGTAFSLMLLVTVAAAAVADRQQSQPLACIAVGGGFLTPFLVGGTQDAHLTLFTYDALLIAGTMVLAQRHAWFALNVLSYAATVVTVLAWFATGYRDVLWLRTLLFLTLYCVMFVQILRDARRAATRTARLTVLVLMTAPAFYHIAAVLLTAQHPPAIHVYMITFVAAGLWLTADPHRPRLRLLVLAASYLPLFGTLTLPDGLSWTAANTVTIVAIAGLHLMALLDRVFRQEQHLEPAELLSLHVLSIGLYALLYRTLAPVYPQLRGAIAAILAAGAIVLWRTMYSRDPVAGLNACALAFTLGAMALAVQFDGPVVTAGWAAEGAAAMWIGLRLANRWIRYGGLALWGLAVLRLMDAYDTTPAGFTAILNERALTTAFVVGLGYALTWMFARHRSTIPDAGRWRAGLNVITSLVTIAWITAEVGSYWDVRYESPQAYLYEQLTLSLAWAAYGACLIVVGMWRHYAPVRYIGITVLAVTILKVFFFDLWELGGIYRVVAFLVFGVLLVAVSYLYQRRKVPTPSSQAAHSSMTTDAS